MRTSKIYRAFNKQNGKSYIGQTVKTLKHRKHQHYYDAKKYACFLFHHALNKYEVEDWEWTILEKDIPLADINTREIYYIAKYDSFNREKGYNSTAGGGGLLDVGKLVKLWHPIHGWQEMCAREYKEKYNLPKSCVSGLTKGVYYQIKGWCTTPDNDNRPKKNPGKVQKENHILHYNGEILVGDTEQLYLNYNINRDSVSRLKKRKSSLVKGVPCTYLGKV